MGQDELNHFEGGQFCSVTVRQWSNRLTKAEAQISIVPRALDGKNGIHNLGLKDPVNVSRRRTASSNVSNSEYGSEKPARGNEKGGDGASLILAQGLAEPTKHVDLSITLIMSGIGGMRF